MYTAPCGWCTPQWVVFRPLLSASQVQPPLPSPFILHLSVPGFYFYFSIFSWTLNISSLLLSPTVHLYDEIIQPMLVWNLHVLFSICLSRWGKECSRSSSVHSLLCSIHMYHTLFICESLRWINENIFPIICLSIYHLFIYLSSVYLSMLGTSPGRQWEHVNCVTSLLFIVGSMQMLKFRYCINSGTHINTHSRWHMHT